jgi:hypothetical protein
MAKPGPRGKRDEIAAEFQRMFPDGHVPRGGITRLARTVGLSKTRVSTVAREMGIYNPPVVDRGTGPCEVCGKETKRPKRLCADCRVITLTCDACGKQFQRPRDRVLEKQYDPRYRGRVFCSWACFNSVPRRVPETETTA